MRITRLTLSLEEFQTALRTYSEDHARSQVEQVIIESYNKPRIVVDLWPGGLIEATAFRHRVKSDDA